jgi:hypothetical protein
MSLTCRHLGEIAIFKHYINISKYESYRFFIAHDIDLFVFFGTNSATPYR